jgi:signal transduction histidine kinase
LWLIAALVTTTIVVSGVLGALAWRLIDQQHALDEQRARDQLERSADTISARVSERLAAAGERLTTWAAEPSPPAGFADAVIVSVTADDTAVVPRGGLPFLPHVPGGTAVPSAALAVAEAAELRDGDRSRAMAMYRALARAGDPPIKAVALMRLAALLRGAGDVRGALACYRTLASMGDILAEQLPAELVGLYGQRAMLQALRDPGEAAVASDLVQKLDRGEWRLLRGTAELYRDEFPAPRPASWQTAAAIDALWREGDGRLPARGQRVFEGTPAPILVLWRSGASRVVLLAIAADAFLRDVLPPSSGWTLATADGHLLAATGEPPARAVTRVIATADFPMTLRIWDSGSPPPAGGSRALALTALAAMLTFLWSATWLMARAIRREAGVARLQSEFVAAVSHEFRSPATTIRQMAEMLALGRVRDHARQQEYYAMLMSEASRLQRLVETLLDFGRMEAGAERYTVADVHVWSVADRVLAELQPQLREAPGRVDVNGPRDVVFRGDEAAIVLALRNLVDNALKYSTPRSPVSVRWQEIGGRVELSVRDRGDGIPPSEHRVIFDRFVRGRGAINASIRGTGLGLAMVRRIATAHGGQVLLASEPGCGSTFTLVLPAAAAGREDIPAATRVQQI